MDARSHWERVYSTQPVYAVSWYQAEPTVSLELIAAAGLPAGAAVVDVGAGASVLVDRLVALGYGVTALDVSAGALRLLRARLGAAAADVSFVEGDVCAAALPASAYALWHDRAVLHFLREPAQQQAYVHQLRRCLVPDGHALIATFDLGGPVRCSGLDVVRYSPETLAELLGPGFMPVTARRESHLTPGGATQHFQYSLFQRVG